jgi:hypothetical protein
MIDGSRRLGVTGSKQAHVPARMWGMQRERHRTPSGEKMSHQRNKGLVSPAASRHTYLHACDGRQRERSTTEGGQMIDGSRRLGVTGSKQVHVPSRMCGTQRERSGPGSDKMSHQGKRLVVA